MRRDLNKVLSLKSLYRFINQKPPLLCECMLCVCVVLRVLLLVFTYQNYDIESFLLVQIGKRDARPIMINAFGF